MVLQKELTRRFEKVLQPTCDSFDPIFVTATFLDPRYRLLMTAQQVTAAKAHLLHECCHLDEERALTETEKVDDAEEPPYKRFKYLSSVLNERLKEQGKTQISQQYQPEHEELERYLIARENEDPLDFWTTNQNICT